MTMSEYDPNDIEMAGPQGPEGTRGGGQDINQSPSERPYGDAGNLYEIPRIRPEDPPLRRWWTDDETQQNDGSPE